MGIKSTKPSAPDLEPELKNLLIVISDHLKKKHNLHALRGTFIQNMAPALYIPELDIPIEVTKDKARDAAYMKLKMLPMVIIPSNLIVDVQMYIDSHIEFHKKWANQSI